MIVFVGILLWVAIGLGNFVDRQLQNAEDLTPSLRVLLGKVLKIALIVTATLVGLSGLGIDLTVFAVFSGAIGVGLGFGLQKVVSNFISGIIILMDRSIKPGDTITLGETFGWIRELRARFVSVVTRDGREYLIPNEDFITHEVINWSFSDALVRLDVEFGVSYDSDPHQISALAIEAAAQCKRVYAAKQPVCWLTAFGDSSLDFVLRFWIVDPREGLTNIRGTVLLALWDTFKEHGIKIPYPHREVIMKTPVEVSGEAG
jgi:small-conductance mechanosensitive channel